MTLSAPVMLPDSGPPPGRFPDPLWLFGYGSLIWRPGFAFAERCRARVDGHARRFWQGSHDHRGVPGAPGRVVTLVPSPGAVCEGMAFRVEPSRAASTLALLDHREQDGYERTRLTLQLDDGRSVPGIAWIAAEGNASWLGDAPETAVVRQIRASAGPSGSNAEYLLALAARLDELGIVDPHVSGLARLVSRRVP